MAEAARRAARTAAGGEAGGGGEAGVQWQEEEYGRKQRPREVWDAHTSMS